MKKPLRIGYARIFHEANAHSPTLTEATDFERFHVMGGAKLALAASLRGAELKGFMPHAELTGFCQAARIAGEVETVPLWSAMCVPSGMLSQHCFAWLLDNLRTAIDQAGHLDGIYLALHGSMQVVNLARAPEAVIIEQVKSQLPDAPIAVSYDLHANLSAGLVEPTAVMVAYQSNPHWDLAPTGFRAGRRLIKVLRGELQPIHAWRKLPMTLGGGTTISFLPPMRAVFRKAKQIEKTPGVISASVFMVHPYTNAEAMGWAVHVSTNGDRALADRLADELADYAWSTRNVSLPPRLSIEQALQTVATSRWKRLGPITLIDEGDIVGAGAPGGNTRIAKALLESHSSIRGLVPLHDPQLVEQLWQQPIGTRCEVTVSGSPGYSQPQFTATVTIAAKKQDGFGRRVRLDCPATTLAITDGSALPVHPSFWTDLGIRLRDFDCMVQKNFFHYRMFHLTKSFQHLLVSSPGATNLDHAMNIARDQGLHPAVVLADWRKPSNAAIPN